MSNSADGGNVVEGKQAAVYIGVSLRMLKQLRDQRAIPFVRVGHRTIRYRKEDLDAFIEANTVKPIGR